MRKMFSVFIIGMLCILTASASYAQIGIFSANVDVDNGQLGAEGSASYDPATDTYTVNGSGADVWNNTGSNFHFVYREWTGDFDLRADVSVSGGLETQAWIKAMLFCAEGLEGWSNYVTTRVRRDGQYSTQWRGGGEASDASTASALRVTGLNPARQRLVRIGNTFSTYYLHATTGEWTLIDSNEVALSETVLVGFGVCSHDLGQIATGTFSKVALGAPIEGPFDLTIDVDNGQLGAEGAAAYDAAAGIYTIDGSGADVWNNTGSNFRFVYKEWSGDFELTADVAVAGGLETQAWIKSMLYAAESLDGWGNYVATRVRRDGQYSTQWRGGGEASDASTASALRVSGLNPARQRLTRVGDSFTTSYLDAASGAWKNIDTNVVVLQDPIFLGLGVCSHDLGQIATGTFSNIELTGGTTDASDWQLY
ncbi:MAG: hypothetical protein AB1656_11880 [Candidatus Omnitrophota bacterium]